MGGTANWNPWHGCHKLSAGCVNCYVYRGDARHGRDGGDIYRTKDFYLPIRHGRDGCYKIPAESLVWTCFTSDFLLEDADGWRPEAWRMIKERSDCRFLFITKRIHRLADCLPPDWGNGYPNVHIVCTVENQRMADARMPIFLSAPIAYKSVACEPLLEKIDLSPYLTKQILQVIAGGESGETARTCQYDWVLDLRRQCMEHEVPFHFKQTGANFVKDGRRYRIPRKLQHQQARKANINTSPARMAQAGDGEQPVLLR